MRYFRCFSHTRKSSANQHIPKSVCLPDSRSQSCHQLWPQFVKFALCHWLSRLYQNGSSFKELKSSTTITKYIRIKCSRPFWFNIRTYSTQWIQYSYNRSVIMYSVQRLYCKSVNPYYRINYSLFMRIGISLKILYE